MKTLIVMAGIYGRIRQWPCGLTRLSVTTRLLGSRVRVSLTVWFSFLGPVVCFLCSGFCDHLIASAEESYRVCVCVCPCMANCVMYKPHQ